MSDDKCEINLRSTKIKTARLVESSNSKNTKNSSCNWCRWSNKEKLEFLENIPGKPNMKLFMKLKTSSTSKLTPYSRFYLYILNTESN